MALWEAPPLARSGPKLQSLQWPHLKISRRPFIWTAKPSEISVVTCKSIALGARKQDVLLEPATSEKIPEPSRSLSPDILYPTDLGIDASDIMPLVDFLLDIGLQESHISKILQRCPRLCCLNPKVIKPMAQYLYSLGVGKNQLRKMVSRHPPLFTVSPEKARKAVQFLRELGVPEKNVVKILTYFPQIIALSVDRNLKLKVEYFESLGVNVVSVIKRSPQMLGLSIKENLQPVTEFFLQRGFSIKEVRDMVEKFACLYCFSLDNNLAIKWEFFLTMDYPRSALVGFPQFFGYSLEKRIKPRYKFMRECGVRLPLSTMLYLRNDNFEKLMARKGTTCY